MHQQLNWLGIDSLMAVELKNRVNADLGTSVSTVTFLQGLPFGQLIGQIEEAVLA
jgi:acyl carrier protein